MDPRVDPKTRTARVRVNVATWLPLVLAAVTVMTALVSVVPPTLFVNVKLDKSDKYRVISPSEVYIGNIDSDDYETADFKLYIERTSDKKIVLPLAVEYKDANNKNYKSIVNLELPLYSSSEAKKLGLAEGNGKSGWIILIVLAVAGFFGYRYWKKRRKH